MKKVHFLAGLPRSGSTLLAGILRQNPRFQAQMSSPLCGLFSGLIGGMSSEGAMFINDDQRKRVLRGLFENYFADAADRDVIFDTNRMWCAKLPALIDIFPDAKIICMVRNVAWVMDSIERIVRKNKFTVSRLFGDDTERATVFSRVEALGQRNRLVGASWSALKEAFYGSQASHLLVIDYEYLARAPARTIGLIYEFLDEPEFHHDFESVEYDEPEFDRHLATPGMHTVRGKIEFTERRTILPPDLFARYSPLSFWTDGAASEANIVAPRRALSTAAAAIPAPPRMETETSNIGG